MNLNSLINRQTITIDDHKWGAREMKDWDLNSREIHIEKKTHFKLNGKNDEVLIKLPINSDSEIIIKSKKKDSIDEIPRELLKEIKQAFEDKVARQNFVRDLILVLTDFQSHLDNLEKAKIALIRIAKHFGLDYKPHEIKMDMTDVLNSYTEQYFDKNGRKYFASIDRNRIKIGEVDKWQEL